MELLDHAERKKPANGAGGGEERSETPVKQEQMDTMHLRGGSGVRIESVRPSITECVRVCVCGGATYKFEKWCRSGIAQLGYLIVSLFSRKKMLSAALAVGLRDESNKTNVLPLMGACDECVPRTANRNSLFHLSVSGL